MVPEPQRRRTMSTNDHSPLFSILVPTYNRSLLVKRAIESALACRGEASFELLVVDDGSTDGTVEALERYKSEPEFRLFVHERNRGLTHARNTGIFAARGRWIVLLDSDNQLLHGTLSKLKELDLEVGPEVGILWGNSVDPQGQTLIQHGQFGTFDGEDILRRKITGGEHFSVLRTELARRFPYQPVCHRHACEALFWYTLGLYTKVRIVPETLGYYETSGQDRFCSFERRLSGAGDLAACHRACLQRLGADFLRLAPEVYWDLYAKVAFYECVDGAWLRSVQTAARGIRGALHAPRNVAVFALTLAGPLAARKVLRRIVE